MSILRGTDPLTDIGTLQATAPAGTLFQAASQFNCLEACRLSAERWWRARATRFCSARFDKRLGAAVALPTEAGPADREQAGTKAASLEAKRELDVHRPARATPTNLPTAPVASIVSSRRCPSAEGLGLASGALDLLGVRRGPKIVTAANSTTRVCCRSADSPVRTQRDQAAINTVRGQLLRAAYFGTLLAAIALRKHTVVLTLIGGGAFGNPHRSIWDAIHWAIAEAEPHVHGVLAVVVNVRSDAVEVADLARATDSGGEIIDITENELRLRR